jgi:hypothetical protein
MREFSLSKEPDLVVKARFIRKGDDAPLTGPGYTVRLYDKDIADEDFLGYAEPDADGVVQISFSHDAFVNDVVFKEARPDFFFVIFKENQPVFTTKVLENVTLEDVEQFRMGVGSIVDLGTFLVDVQ